MTPAEYIQAALRTENTPPFVDQDEEASRLVHASMGLNTEQAEFTDALKKLLIYGKPLDRQNLAEELGDILWYAAVAIDALGTTFEAVMEANIRKLRTRFPDKFSSQAALVRDLPAEREALESRPVRDGGDHVTRAPVFLVQMQVPIKIDEDFAEAVWHTEAAFFTPEEALGYVEEMEDRDPESFWRVYGIPTKGQLEQIMNSHTTKA